MIKLFLSLLVFFYLIGNAVANQSPTAAQIEPNCGPWNKNLTCTQNNQQLVDNVVDQLQTGYTWNSISATTQTFVNGNAYIPTNSSLTTFSLPLSPAIGDHYQIVGRGAGGWTLIQNASQTVYFGLRNTTTGTGGSLTSTNNRDAVEIICVASNEFEVINSQGNITII